MRRITKATLIEQIEVLQEKLQDAREGQRIAQCDNSDLSEQLNHYKAEVKRLSKIAKRTSVDLESLKEKHGDFVVTSQGTLMNLVEIMRSVRPRLEKSDIQTWLKENTTYDYDIREYKDVPF